MKNNCLTLTLLSLAVILVVPSEIHSQSSFPDKIKSYSLFKPEKIFDMLSQELVREMRDESNASGSAVLKANQILASAWKPELFEISGKIDRLDKDNRSQRSSQLTIYDSNVRSLGHYFSCTYTIEFDESESGRVLKLDRGQRIRLTGTVQKVDFGFVGRFESNLPNAKMIQTVNLRVQVKASKLK